MSSRPRALAGLATDCSWTPGSSDDDEREAAFSGQNDLPEQACVYDPCFAPAPPALAI